MSRIEKLARIAALSIDPSAHEGERQAAAHMHEKLTRTARTAARRYGIASPALPRTLDLYA